MFEVRVETNFSSAHHLLNYKGKCENMHGHNWKVEVTACGNELDESNILIDFKVFQNYIDKVKEQFPHLSYQTVLNSLIDEITLKYLRLIKK